MRIEPHVVFLRVEYRPSSVLNIPNRSGTDGGQNAVELTIVSFPRSWTPSSSQLAIRVLIPMRFWVLRARIAGVAAENASCSGSSLKLRPRDRERPQQDMLN